MKEVFFTIRGDGDTSPVHAESVMGVYGWVVHWNSANIPNGNYTAVSTSVTYGGRPATSGAVHFHVVNSQPSPRPPAANDPGRACVITRGR